ncbi:MAG: hypothetical protein H6591_05380 [Flavobacteriales bacterium]|nr:hypothetical protein [Flavobacteriales bacterium]
MLARNIRLAVFHVVLPGAAFAQCTFPAVATLQPVCDWNSFLPPCAIGASIQFLGGTPPYSYHVGSYHNGSTTQSSITFIDPTPNGGAADYLMTATDANGCTFSGGLMFGGASSYLDIATFTRALVPNGGNWDLRLTGGAHPSYLPANALCGLSYALTLNGSPYASGTMASIFSTTIQGFQLSALPMGNYTLTTSITPGSCGTYPYWCSPQVGSIGFMVPQAGDTGVNLWLSAGLAGAMQADGLMDDGLRSTGVMPLTEPYSAAGYTYVGTAPGATITAGLAAVSGATAAVDWVVVELRSTTAPYPVVASRPALIRRDGEVMDTDGDPYVNFPGLAAGSYRVALRHRNHLGVMSNVAISLAQVPERVNFRAGNAYGSAPQTAMGGVQCLWPGDAVADGTIRYIGADNDRDPLLVAIGGNTPTNVVSNVYSPLDVNMDGRVQYVGNGNDRDFSLTTVGGSVPTATRTQQLP